MAVTINDVALKARVSKSTISCYLNGRFESMSLETRERIASVIAEMEFRPNALARSLKQKRTHTIAAIVANILNPFSTSVIRGAEDCCKQAGMNLILCNADDDPAKEKEYVQMLLSKQVDGLIINTTGFNNLYIKDISTHTPVVLIDRKVPEIQCDTVAVNGSAGSRLAVEHLLALGYRNITMFTLPYKGISPREERVEGFKQALSQQGLSFHSDALVETEADEDVLVSHLDRLMKQVSRPNAIFGANNLMTMAVIKAAKKLKLVIPDDIAVIGFDDWEWAPLMEPPVTVVAQPTYAMGEKAAATLLKRIKSGRLNKKPVLIVYEPELIPRKSCGEG